MDNRKRSGAEKRSCPTEEHLPRVSVDDTKIAGRHQFHRRGVVQLKNIYLGLEWTTLRLLEDISSTEEELSNRTLT